MKLNVLLLLSAIQLAAVNAERLNPRHVAKRQGAPLGGAPAASPPPSAPAPTAPPSSAAPPAQHPTSAAPPPPPPAPPSQGPPAPPAPSSAAPAPPVGPSSALPGLPGSVAPSAATPTGPPPMATYTGVPPLASISLGMPTRGPLPAATTYSAGSKPPLTGAPAIPAPAATAYQLSSWPRQDQIPPTDSPQVQEWLKELDGYNIPNLSPTVNGSCALSPAQAADAANRGWWTCGGHTRPTDILACPTKYDWGLSFDDGPSGYTQYLLNYLDQKDISATFFVVGSRVIQYPALLIEEYMSGHEISVHTWSHPSLTTLTNEQIVAELGHTRDAIKTFTGVTPTTMRPPYGDIDDRVRAISLAMGLIPILWTSAPNGAGTFDTNDWKVAGGMVNGTDSFNSFQQILSDASTLDTGFIVLEHDLFEQAVDLAVGYTLDAALNHNPPFKLQSIGRCQGMPEGNLYLETNTNTTFPYKQSAGVDVSGDGTIDTHSGDNGTTSTGAAGTKSAGFTNSIPFFTSLIAVGFAAFSLKF